MFRFLVFAVTLLGASHCQDPCSLIRSDVTLLSSFRACDQSVPFSTATRDSTLSTLLSFIDIYSFKDMSSNSGPPFNITRDPLSSLNSLKTEVFIGSRAFHDAVGDVFVGLLDAHTEYRKPDCHAAVAYVPLVVSSEVREGAQVVVAAGVLAKQLVTLYQAVAPGWTEMEGYAAERAVVVSVDGVDAMTALRTAPQIIGKDQGIAFNYNLANFFVRDLASSSWRMLRSDTVTLRLRSPSKGDVTVVLPWAAAFDYTNNAPLTSAKWAALCNKPSAVRAMIATTGSREAIRAATWKKRISPMAIAPEFPVDRLHRVLGLPAPGERRRELHRPRRSALAASATPSSSGALYQSDFVTAGKIGGKTDACVLYIPSFLPVGYDECSKEANPDKCANLLITKLFADMASAVKAVFAAKCARIVVDVSSNGGGLACLANAIASYLVPAIKIDVTVIYDFAQAANGWDKSIVSICEAEKIDGCSLSAYRSPSDITNRVASTSALFQSIQRTRGGKSSPYSSRFRMACTDITSLAAASPPPVFYPANRIFVLSDGICGSTCASFVRLLKFQGGVTDITYGGFVGTAMGSSTFPGGTVENAADNAAFFKLLQDNLPNFRRADYPPDFTTSASLSFNHFEGYSPQKGREEFLMEFEANPSALRLDLWRNYVDSTFETTTLWPAVAAASPLKADPSSTCEAGTFAPCTDPKVTDTTQGYACVSGSLAVKCTTAVKKSASSPATATTASAALGLVMVMAMVMVLL